jgi:hypothetical protein
LATWLLARLSHLPESNWRPTDYKSVALPAELRWRLFEPYNFPVIFPPLRKILPVKPRPFYIPPLLVTPAENQYRPDKSSGGRFNKELPPNFGKAKVREFAYCKNFAMGIFCLFSASCE